MRLRNRRVRKFYNKVPYYGKIIDVFKDTDEEILYGVLYPDTDYEQYSFHEIMEILQPHDPIEDAQDVVEITSFFGSSKSQRQLMDVLSPKNHQTQQQTDPVKSTVVATDALQSENKA